MHAFSGYFLKKKILILASLPFPGYFTLPSLHRNSLAQWQTMEKSARKRRRDLWSRFRKKAGGGGGGFFPFLGEAGGGRAPLGRLWGEATRVS